MYVFLSRVKKKKDFYDILLKSFNCHHFLTDKIDEVVRFLWKLIMPTHQGLIWFFFLSKLIYEKNVYILSVSQ